MAPCAPEAPTPQPPGVTAPHAAAARSAHTCLIAASPRALLRRRLPAAGAGGHLKPSAGGGGGEADVRPSPVRGSEVTAGPAAAPLPASAPHRASPPGTAPVPLRRPHRSPAPDPSALPVSASVSIPAALPAAPRAVPLSPPLPPGPDPLPGRGRSPGLVSAAGTWKALRPRACAGLTALAREACGLELRPRGRRSVQRLAGGAARACPCARVPGAGARASVSPGARGELRES